MDDPCCEKEILPYMVANLINGKVEFVAWFKAWFVNLFRCVFGKIKVLERSLRKNEILASMVICLIYVWRLGLSLDVLWCERWYLNLFGSKFGKYNVLGWPLSRKWDISLYDYLFDIYEGWACPSMSLGAKDDIWTYLVLNSLNIKYWDDPCAKMRF